MNKPVFLCDLDDTLFQTRRKMVDELDLPPFRVGALDRSLTPRSFMTEEQSMLVDWLLEHAEFIPVTARGTEEISRVNIPFSSWAITTHGAVILTPDRQPDAGWQDTVLTNLQPYRDRLIAMESRINDMMAERGLNAWCRINYEYGDTPVYFVMKHRDSTQIAELYASTTNWNPSFPLMDFIFTVTATILRGYRFVSKKAWRPLICLINYATNMARFRFWVSAIA